MCQQITPWSASRSPPAHWAKNRKEWHVLHKHLSRKKRSQNTGIIFLSKLFMNSILKISNKRLAVINYFFHGATFKSFSLWILATCFWRKFFFGVSYSQRSHAALFLHIWLYGYQRSWLKLVSNIYCMSFLWMFLCPCILYRPITSTLQIWQLNTLVSWIFWLWHLSSHLSLKVDPQVVQRKVLLSISKFNA